MFGSDETAELPSVADDEEYLKLQERLESIREELSDVRERDSELAPRWRELDARATVPAETTLVEQVADALEGETATSPQQEVAAELRDLQARRRRLETARGLLERGLRKRRKSVSRQVVVGEPDEAYRERLAEAVEAARDLRERLDALEAFEDGLEERGVLASYLNPVTTPTGEVDGFVTRAEERLEVEIPPVDKAS